MLKKGEAAPDFLLESQTGEKISLEQFRGKKVVLYFYPKDNTPGCTKEACSLRDYHREILSTGTAVVGVSPDSIPSHQKFTEKYTLPFPLLSDPDHAVAESYGAWGEKKNYGKTYFGIIRSTFVIDENGTVEKVFAKVNTATHGQEVLDYLTKA